jgi:hypothetical protein
MSLEVARYRRTFPVGLTARICVNGGLVELTGPDAARRAFGPHVEPNPARPANEKKAQSQLLEQF